MIETTGRNGDLKRETATVNESKNDEKKGYQPIEEGATPPTIGKHPSLAIIPTSRPAVLYSSFSRLTAILLTTNSLYLTLSFIVMVWSMFLSIVYLISVNQFSGNKFGPSDFARDDLPQLRLRFVAMEGTGR